MDEHERDDIGQGPSTSAFGQFSLAPATRTTVVTTTTTTTTSFPPLIIRPPRATKDLDARQYPLAASPTPAALRNLTFKIGDKSVVFNEPEDTTATATEVCLSLSLPSHCAGPPNTHIFPAEREERGTAIVQRFDPVHQLV